MRIRAGALLGSIGCLVPMVLAGCAHELPQRDPAYAAVYPPPLPPTEQTGAIYNTGYSMNWYSDARAYRIGDVITIVLAENMNGTKTATTNTDKTNDITQTINQLFGLSPRHTQQDYGLDIQADRTFRSNGTSAQRNALTGMLAVTVARVLPNGNLVVRGEKSIGLNQGSEVIQFSGIIRAEDITPANTVLSTQVADARISYRGSGVLDETNRQGWLGRFFSSPVWPF